MVIIVLTCGERALLIQALDAYRGDDFERAQAAWSRYTPEQMSLPHGQSGLTPDQLLGVYREHVQNVSALRRRIQEAA